MVVVGVEKKKDCMEFIMMRGVVINKIYFWINGCVFYIIYFDFGEYEDFIRIWIKFCFLRCYMCVWEGYFFIESMVFVF